ncbi:MAG: AbrB/MazE/SpoVT family DNA-binding domain-containing protein [Candidatus Aenigmarchaeota archaeon]|nr:AbrB/MazE/SpoVT family DNA-binding domain-containing protein [Candidatus Aenigmarchaeota archaeon]
MVDFERKVGPKGQVVIPKEIRKSLGIYPNMKVFLFVSDHTVMINKTKKGIADIFEDLVEKDGKYVKKINTDRFYEKEIKERWK